MYFMFMCIYYVCVCARVHTHTPTVQLCVEVTGQCAGVDSLLLPLDPGTELRLTIRIDSSHLIQLIISLALSTLFR